MGKLAQLVLSLLFICVGMTSVWADSGKEQTRADRPKLQAKVEAFDYYGQYSEESKRIFCQVLSVEKDFELIENGPDIGSYYYAVKIPVAEGSLVAELQVEKVPKQVNLLSVTYSFRFALTGAPGAINRSFGKLQLPELLGEFPPYPDAYAGFQAFKPNVRPEFDEQRYAVSVYFNDGREC